MSQRVALRQRERRCDDQHMRALGQVFQRSEAVCAVDRKALRPRKRRLFFAVHKAAGVHSRGQRIAHRVARRAEQHRTHPGGKAAFIKQAANQGGGNSIHHRKSFRSTGAEHPHFHYTFIIQQAYANCISIFR